MITTHGYKKIYLPNHPLSDTKGFVYEHRLIMSQLLHRILLSSEIVHHKDRNKLNNHPSNLEIVKSIAHHYLKHRKNQFLRKPEELNITIKCKCGCGTLLLKYDASGRPRQFISGHNPRKPRNICACGCGETVKTISAKFRPNHWSKKHVTRLNNPIIQCQCGCNQQLIKFDKYGRERKFIIGHARRLK